ncbi:MAG: DinB family protein [Ignavibacteriae bacterium]|nr:DinB family protein [Ignavibacteriota bacterium]
MPTRTPKQPAPLIDQVLSTWRVHNEIMTFLIGQIPAKGLEAVPHGSRGRTIAEQLVHLNSVRLGWLQYHRTGKRPRASEVKRTDLRSAAQFKKAFQESHAAVEEFLRETLEGTARPRAFKGSSVRWMGYLISHESHHRGSIMLTLKQNGVRMKDDVALGGLWGKWMWDKQ